MRKNTIILMMSLLLIGCSTTTNLKIIDPTGRDIPSPHYVLRSLYNGMTATFYYASLSVRKDIDGTIIQRPTYLPMNQIYTTISLSELVLIIEISNPKKVKYKVWEHSSIKKWKKNSGETRGVELAKSNLEYRQFVFKMPMDSEIKEVSYGVSICEEESGEPIMYFQDFRYKIKKKKGEEVIDYF